MRRNIFGGRARSATSRHEERREILARGNSAAARLRRIIRKSGRWKCVRCGRHVLASAIDVDHIQPLALGGSDTDGNVQPLCRPCHRLKTREDFGAAGPPFRTPLRTGPNQACTERKGCGVGAHAALVGARLARASNSSFYRAA
ncbi:HNH endonuclease [Streptomyces sp. G1]|nr:HNH endonuclease [Streptomyces sp. G1]